MKNRAISKFLVAALILGIGISVFAQGKKKETARVTQAELARTLVNVLGLARFLPAEPSDQECFSVLLDSNISPEKGWQAGEVVNRAALARVLVQAMGLQSKVKNPEDPLSWIELLKELDIPIDTVGAAVDTLRPLPEPVARNVFIASTTSDPINKRDKFGGETEREFGTDIGYSIVTRPITLGELRTLIDQVDFNPQPRPVPTPD